MLQLTRRLDNSRHLAARGSNPAAAILEFGDFLQIRKPLLHLFAHLPLPLVHGLGALLGLISLASPSLRRLMADNLRQAGLYSPGLLTRAAMELGKGMAELVPIWLLPLESILAWVREVRGMEHVDAARTEGRGLVLLGPHLGCLELAGLYLAARFPVTAMYRRPRQDWVHEMMMHGRNRGLGNTVEASMRGVRGLLAALKRKEAVWVLPDQKANKGEGEWVPLFGRWAYMPTLLYWMAQSSGSRPLMLYCERLTWGRGYRIHIQPLPDLPGDTGAAMRLANAIMEEAVRRLPAQYLWSYDLFRRRQGETVPAGPPR